MPTDPILVIDDNPANLKLARLMLESEDYDVRTAVDAEAALALLEERSWRPRAILMDLQLPGMDGLELTRRLKADPAFATIPIIAVTAYAMKGDREKAMAAGCDAYVTKPIDSDLLAATISTLLAGGRAQP